MWGWGGRGVQNNLCSCFIFCNHDCWKKRKKKSHETKKNTEAFHLSSETVLIWILPLSHSPHTRLISSKSSPSLRMETNPLRRTQCWLWPPPHPAVRHQPSSTDSSQQLLESNKGNPKLNGCNCLRLTAARATACTSTLQCGIQKGASLFLFASLMSNYTASRTQKRRFPQTWRWNWPSTFWI